MIEVYKGKPISIRRGYIGYYKKKRQYISDTRELRV